MWLNARIKVLFVVLGVLLIGSVSAATHLELRCRGPNGEPIRITRAELLLVNWGAVGRLSLDPKGAILQMDMKPAWLQSRWSDRFYDLEKAFIYIQAKGYVPIRSEGFLWLGTHDISPNGKPFGERVTGAKIDFRQKKSVTVHEGENVELDVVLRRPQQKIVRFLGESGTSASDLKVDVGMFWSDSNHCGGLAGVDRLVQGVTDSRGDLSVPDGDFQYVFQIESPRVVFDNPEMDVYPQRLMSFLHKRKTIFRVHHYERKPLSVDIIGEQGPLQGIILFGNLSGCPCGACYGGMGTSDDRGEIRIQDFYPEEYNELWLCANGREVWTADPNKLSDGVITIRFTPAKLTESPTNWHCKF